MNTSPITGSSASAPVRLGSIAGNLQAERFACGLDVREWVVTAQPRGTKTYAFLMRSGSGQAHLADNVVELAAPCLVWLPARTALRCRFEAGTTGAMFSANDEFLRRQIETNIEALELGRLWARSIIVCSESLHEGLDELDMSFAALEREVREPRRASAALAAAHLAIILLSVWRAAGRVRGADRSPLHRSLVVERFVDLVELHFAEHWTVSRYARALAVSDDRLQATCTRVTGYGPLAHIHKRTIDEARKRLARSLLPVETIAAQLGFGDPGYFNRFFKKHVGQSPGVFRRKQIAASLEATSFATWP